MKVAVVGSGHLGKRHVRIWSNMNEVEVVGVITRSIEQNRELEKTYRVKLFESLEELMKETAVDVIDICTPTYTHVEWISKAAQAGKQVICEKPLALTKKEAMKAIRVCEEKGVQLLVGHTLRFFPEYRKAKEEVQKGTIGQPGVIRLARTHKAPGTARGWYTDKQKSGGVIFDLGIHEFDWLNWTFGPVERVMAKRIKHRNENGEDIEYGLVTLKLKSGAIAHIELSWAETAFFASFELTGDKGLLSSNNHFPEPLAIHIRDSTSDEQQSGKDLLPKTLLAKDPFEQQLEHFYRVLSGKEEPVISATEAADAVCLAEAALISAKTGEPVEIEGREDL